MPFESAYGICGLTIGFAVAFYLLEKSKVFLLNLFLHLLFTLIILLIDQAFIFYCTLSGLLITDLILLKKIAKRHKETERAANLLKSLHLHRGNPQNLPELCEGYQRSFDREFQIKDLYIYLQTSLEHKHQISTNTRLKDIADYLRARKSDNLLVRLNSLQGLYDLPLIFTEKLLDQNSFSKQDCFFYLNIQGFEQNFGSLAGITSSQDYILIETYLRLIESDATAHIFNLLKAHEKDQLNKVLSQQVKLHTRELHKKNKTLKQRERDIRTFFANMTHDIRTPLSLITIPLETLLQNSNNLSVHQKRQLEKIRAATYRTIGIISNILDISRLDAGKKTFHGQPHDIVEIVNRICDLYAGAIEAHGMKFRTDFPNVKIMAILDLEKFEKIVNNLLSNAVKYNRKNKTISVAIRKQKSKIILDITDQGKGIPASDLPKVFNRYHRAVNAKGGTGIGLSLVKDFVKMHNGSIHVESRPERITRFRIQLPALPQGTKKTSQPNWEPYHTLTSLVETQANAALMSNRHALPTVALLPYPPDQDLPDPQEELNLYYNTITFPSFSAFLRNGTRHPPDLIILARAPHSTLAKLNEIPVLRYTPRIFIDSQFPEESSLSAKYHINELLERCEKLLQENAIRGKLREYYSQLHRQIEEARQMQNILAPSVSSVLPHWVIWKNSRPAFRLSGDGVLYKKHNDNSLSLFMYDISGTGLTSSVLSVLVQTLIHAHFETEKKNPRESIQALQTLRPLLTGHFISAISLTIDVAKRELHYVSYGHPPVLLKNKSTVSLHRTHAAIGMPVEQHAETKIIKLKEPSVRLLAFSHGYLAMRREDGKMLDEQYFSKKFKSARHAAELLAMSDRLHEMNKNLADDLNFVVVESQN